MTITLHSQAGRKKHGVLQVAVAQLTFGLNEALAAFLYHRREVGEYCYFDVSQGAVTLFPHQPQRSILAFIILKCSDEGMGGAP